MAEEVFVKIVKKVTISIPMAICKKNWPAFTKQQISAQLIESIGRISRVDSKGLHQTVAISFLPNDEEQRYLITYNVVLDQAVTEAVHKNFTKFPIF